MPLFDLCCEACGTTNKDILIPTSVIKNANEKPMNLNLLGIKCKKCGQTIFKRLPAAHGKMSSNWSSWQTKK